MGTISLYSRLYEGVYVTQQPAPKMPELSNPGVPLLEDAKDVTLAQYSKYTKDVLTAHKMKDYRRKRFNLVLLPEVNTLFDRLIEGSEYWGALLRDEGPYS